MPPGTCGGNIIGAILIWPFIGGIIIWPFIPAIIRGGIMLEGGGVMLGAEEGWPGRVIVKAFGTDADIDGAVGIPCASCGDEAAAMGPMPTGGPVLTTVLGGVAGA